MNNFKFKAGDVVEYCLSGHSSWHGSLFRIIECLGLDHKPETNRYRAELIKGQFERQKIGDRAEMREWCFKLKERKPYTYREIKEEIEANR